MRSRSISNPARLRPSFFSSAPRALGALACVSSLAIAAPVWAQTSIPASPAEAREQAKRLFDQGALDYTNGNYEAAIQSWQKAYDLSKEPLIYENLGNAYERLGRNKEARDALSKWREVAPPAEKSILDRRIQNLDKRIAREDADAAERQKRDADLNKQIGDKPRTRIVGPDFSIPGVILTAVGGAAVIAGVVVDGVAAGSRPDESTVCKKQGDRQLCLGTAKDDISKSNTLASAGDATWIIGGLAAAAGVTLILTYPLLTPSKATPDRAPASSPSGSTGPHASIAPNTPRDVRLIPWGGADGGGLVVRGDLF